MHCCSLRLLLLLRVAALLRCPASWLCCWKARGTTTTLRGASAAARTLRASMAE